LYKLKKKNRKNKKNTVQDDKGTINIAPLLTPEVPEAIDFGSIINNVSIINWYSIWHAT